MVTDSVPNQISYIEWPARNLPATRSFFEAVFGWQFTDYGDQYTAFTGTTVSGGFFHCDKASLPQNGAALVVIYSDDLEACLRAVEAGGGTITQVIFEFPGGRRFHFQEPSGNELAVWSDR